MPAPWLQCAYKAKESKKRKSNNTCVRVYRKSDTLSFFLEGISWRNEQKTACINLLQNVMLKNIMNKQEKYKMFESKNF